VSDLRQEIEAYEDLRSELELTALGKWVVVKGKKPIGTYDSFEAAAEEAVKKFGRGPYLIRRVGDSAVTIPASVMYRFG
jgi:hypothetical protein